MTGKFAANHPTTLRFQFSLWSILAIMICSHSIEAFGFTIDEASAAKKEKEIHLSFTASIELTTLVTDALRAGVPVTIVTEGKIYRVRSDMWDDLIGQYESTDVIRYRSLYRDYVINKDGSENVESYASLTEALQSLAEQRNLKLLLTEQDLESPDAYRGKVRVFLKRSALPSVMQLPAFFNDSWRLNTGWRHFDVL